MICYRDHPLNPEEESRIGEDGVVWFQEYYDPETGDTYSDPFIDTSVTTNYKRRAPTATKASLGQFQISSLQLRYRWQAQNSYSDGQSSVTDMSELGRSALEVTADDGSTVTFRAGDCVYLRPTQPDEKLYVAQVGKLWEAEDEYGEPDILFNARWFFRAEDTLLDDHSCRMIREKELFQSDDYEENTIKSVVGKCHVVYLPHRQWGDEVPPDAPELDFSWICEREDVYFYRYLYNNTNFTFLDPHVIGNQDEDCSERFCDVDKSELEDKEERERKANKLAEWDLSTQYAASPLGMNLIDVS